MKEMKLKQVTKEWLLENDTMYVMYNPLFNTMKVEYSTSKNAIIRYKNAIKELEFYVLEGVYEAS